MNILVIKQTSLGDVLHATGHIRAIKTQYPDSRLVLLTATTSADIFRHNPWVDELILVDRYQFKKTWYRRPLRAFGHIFEVMGKVRSMKFDLAVDLQGLAKSVVFLYGARADNKFCKGNWLGIPGYRNKDLHATTEMDRVLALAGINIEDTAMEFPTGDNEKRRIDELTQQFKHQQKPILVMSPYSRWPSKDWPVTSYIKTAEALQQEFTVCFTGAPERAGDIDNALNRSPELKAYNLCGQLDLLEFVEFTSRARVMLTGDSFPMHVAAARKVPVVALFGPTDESRVGPTDCIHHILRAPGCDRCDRPRCGKMCLNRLRVNDVVAALRSVDGK